MTTGCNGRKEKDIKNYHIYSYNNKMESYKIYALSNIFHRNFLT